MLTISLLISKNTKSLKPRASMRSLFWLITTRLSWALGDESKVLRIRYVEHLFVLNFLSLSDPRLSDPDPFWHWRGLVQATRPRPARRWWIEPSHCSLCHDYRWSRDQVSRGGCHILLMRPHLFILLSRSSLAGALLFPVQKPFLQSSRLDADDYESSSI